MTKKGHFACGLGEGETSESCSDIVGDLSFPVIVGDGVHGSALPVEEKTFFVGGDDVVGEAPPGKIGDEAEIPAPRDVLNR